MWLIIFNYFSFKFKYKYSIIKSEQKRWIQLKKISPEYKEKVLEAFNRSEKRKPKTCNIQIGNRTITDVPYYQHGCEKAFSVETYNVLQYIEKGH